MLFNSFIFWVFFFTVFAIYLQLSHRKQNLLLLVSSYLFYGYWDWRFLSLILISTIVDFFTAQKIYTSTGKGKKLYLYISVASNLGILGFFKYYNFFSEQLLLALSFLGFHPSILTLNIILPVGISFYTFQTMSYTIDVYNSNTKPTNSFLDFALYVSFFPQLVAGPIERSFRLLPQIALPRFIRAENLQEGLYLISLGLFKKVIIADNLAPFVDLIFSSPSTALTGIDCLIGVYAFSAQIYCDFSGYSDIARGLAKMMGFDLMLNFNMPYFASSPSDFWRRWHISLSTWLRDYLYIPLGGNKKGGGKTIRNLFITMGLGGLWHGAAWNFIIWGIYHGFLLVVYRIIGNIIPISKIGSSAQHRFSNLVQIVIFFHLTVLGWLFFRANSTDQILMFIGKILTDLTYTSLSSYGIGLLIFFFLPLVLYETILFLKNDQLILLKSNAFYQTTVLLYAILMLLVFPPMIYSEFIYFQF